MPGRGIVIQEKGKQHRSQPKRSPVVGGRTPYNRGRNIMANPKTRNVKPNATLNTASNTMTTDATPLLPSPSAPVVADNVAPNGAPTTSADPADLTNAAPEAGPVVWDVRGYVHTLPGGTPVKDTGFSPLLGRAIDVYLGRALNRERGAVAMATVRACYKAGINVRIDASVDETSPLTVLCAVERVALTDILSKLVNDKDEGKRERTLTSVGRRMAASEKAILRAVKATGMSAGAVRETGASIARAIVGVDTTVEAQRSFMRSFRA